MRAIFSHECAHFTALQRRSLLLTSALLLFTLTLGRCQSNTTCNSNECRESEVSCEGAGCTILCEDFNACNDANITCDDCNLRCVGQTACYGATVTVKGSGMRSMTCDSLSSANNACAAVRIIFAANADLDSPLRCEGHKSCELLTFEAPQSNNIEVVCDGEESCHELEGSCGEGSSCSIRSTNTSDPSYTRNAVLSCVPETNLCDCGDSGVSCTVVSEEPTTSPTLSTDIPTLHTEYPSLNPSMSPSETPSSNPTLIPTAHPTMNPSSSPSAFPSHFPSLHPSGFPTLEPTGMPTVYDEEPPPPPSDTGWPSASPTTATDIPSVSFDGPSVLEPSISPTQPPSVEVAAFTGGSDNRERVPKIAIIFAASTMLLCVVLTWIIVACYCKFERAQQQLQLGKTAIERLKKDNRRLQTLSQQNLAFNLAADSEHGTVDSMDTVVQSVTPIRHRKYTKEDERDDFGDLAASSRRSLSKKRASERLMLRDHDHQSGEQPPPPAGPPPHSEVELASQQRRNYSNNLTMVVLDVDGRYDINDEKRSEDGDYGGRPMYLTPADLDERTLDVSPTVDTESVMTELETAAPPMTNGLLFSDGDSPILHDDEEQAEDEKEEHRTLGTSIRVDHTDFLEREWDKTAASVEDFSAGRRSPMMDDLRVDLGLTSGGSTSYERVALTPDGMDEDDDSAVQHIVLTIPKDESALQSVVDDLKRRLSAQDKKLSENDTKLSQTLELVGSLVQSISEGNETSKHSSFDSRSSDRLRRLLKTQANPHQPAMQGVGSSKTGTTPGVGVLSESKPTMPAKKTPSKSISPADDYHTTVNPETTRPSGPSATDPVSVPPTSITAATVSVPPPSKPNEEVTVSMLKHDDVTAPATPASVTSRRPLSTTSRASSRKSQTRSHAPIIRRTPSMASSQSGVSEDHRRETLPAKIVPLTGGGSDTHFTSDTVDDDFSSRLSDTPGVLGDTEIASPAATHASPVAGRPILIGHGQISYGNPHPLGQPAVLPHSHAPVALPIGMVTVGSPRSQSTSISSDDDDHRQNQAQRMKGAMDPTASASELISSYGTGSTPTAKSYSTRVPKPSPMAREELILENRRSDMSHHFYYTTSEDDEMAPVRVDRQMVLRQLEERKKQDEAAAAAAAAAVSAGGISGHGSSASVSAASMSAAVVSAAAVQRQRGMTHDSDSSRDVYGVYGGPVQPVEPLMLHSHPSQQASEDEDDVDTVVSEATTLGPPLPSGTSDSEGIISLPSSPPITLALNDQPMTVVKSPSRSTVSRKPGSTVSTASSLSQPRPLDGSESDRFARLSETSIDSIEDSEESNSVEMGDGVFHRAASLAASSSSNSSSSSGSTSDSGGPPPPLPGLDPHHRSHGSGSSVLGGSGVDGGPPGVLGYGTRPSLDSPPEWTSEEDDRSELSADFGI